MEGTLSEPGIIIFNSDKIRGGLPLWVTEGTLKAEFYIKEYKGGLKLIHPFRVEGNQEAIDFVRFHKDNNELNDILEKESLRQQRIADYVYSFLETRISARFSPLLIRNNIGILGLEQANFLYALLDEGIKSSEEGESLKKQLERDEKNLLGNKVSDFVLPDTSGSPVGLYQFAEKFTLIDFWASWCGPCRIANRELVRLYPMLKEKRVKVLGVSLDENSEDWHKAIKKDNLLWTHVSDLQGFNSEVVKSFRITGIPYKILIDEDRKILAVGLENIKSYLEKL